EEARLIDAVRAADERQRPPGDVRHDPLRDGLVICGHVAFRETEVGVENAIGVRESNQRPRSLVGSRLLRCRRAALDDTAERRLTDLAIVGPFAERHVCGELWAYPVDAATAEARRKRRERTRRRRERFQPAPDRLRRLVREPGADFAGACEPSGVVPTADDQR